MGAREHFWELRREVEINAIKNNQNQLKKRKFLRRVWIPLRKISVNNMFLSFNNEFDLKRTWQIFKEYKFYKERRDEVSFVLEGVEKALEEEITSFKEMEEMESDVSGAKEKILEYPQYTRPEKFLNWKVPKILLSGNHQKIAEWRKNKQKKKPR